MSVNYEEFLERALCRENGIDYRTRISNRKHASRVRFCWILLCVGCFALGAMVGMTVR